MIRERDTDAFAKVCVCVVPSGVCVHLILLDTSMYEHELMFVHELMQGLHLMSWTDQVTIQDI